MRPTIVWIALAVLFVTGCTNRSGMNGPAPRRQAGSSVRGEGMEVSVHVPKRQWRTGDTIPVEVTAVNTTDSPIGIVSPSGAPVLVRVMRPVRGSFERVRQYPQSATSNIVNWTLPANGARTYKLRVPVEPDWPVAEPLRLTAELNGYPKYSPIVTITVQP